MNRDDLREIAREYGDQPVVFLDEEGIRENALVLQHARNRELMARVRSLREPARHGTRTHDDA